MRSFIIVVLIFSSLGMYASPALAVISGVDSSGHIISGVDTGSNIYLVNPLKGVDCSSGNGDCLMAFLQSILTYVIRIGTIVVILMIVYVGYLFVIAQGVPGEIQKARQALLWTIVGALILLGSQAIAISIKATVQTLGTGTP